MNKIDEPVRNHILNSTNLYQSTLSTGPKIQYGFGESQHLEMQQNLVQKKIRDLRVREESSISWPLERHTNSQVLL